MTSRAEDLELCRQCSFLIYSITLIEVTSSLFLSIMSHLLLGKIPAPLGQAEAALDIYKQF